MAQRSPKKASKRDAQDVVLVYGQSEGGSYEVLRQRNGEVQAGTMRPLDEGKPILGEVVRLKPRQEAPFLFDVEVQHDARPPRGRPPKVATERYRKGWESIWAKRQEPRRLN
jgi:hypothetical protein